MKSLILTGLAVVTASFAGCSTYENAARLQAMLAEQPMRFNVARDSVAVTWTRGTRYFEEFGRPKLEYKNETKLRTEYTALPNSRYRLQLEQEPAGDSVAFVIGHDWLPGIAGGGEDRERALRIVREYAYYVRTGDTPSAWLKRRP